MQRVTKRESKIPKDFAKKIIAYLRNNLSKDYKFFDRLVGSGNLNTIIKDKNGFWDLDYQLILTANSGEYKNNKLNNPTKIKNDFFNCLNNKYKHNKNIKVENSTTAITVINLDSKYSIDLVIIKLYPQYSYIIRRNNNSTKNLYTWNKLPNNEHIYDVLNCLSPQEKQDLIENYILPAKIKEKSKNNGDVTKKSSFEIFIQEVNNYENRRKNHRL